MNNNKILIEKDIDELYIGNLNTVDADLFLPKVGRNGSNITWKSMEKLFINDNGEVTRPTSGVGNRVVKLIATFNRESISKNVVYDVTVLEEPKNIKISKVLPIEVKNIKESKLDLPPVAIVLCDDGIFTTLPVKWENYKSNDKIINGNIIDFDTKVTCTIIKTDLKNEWGRVNKENKGYTKDMKLSDGIFKKAQDDMLKFLLTVDVDEILYNFREVAGLDTKGANPMTGWDAPNCNLKGHTTGHYLSAFALGWRNTKNEKFNEKIEYMTSSLLLCQKALEKAGCSKGYLGAYDEEQFNLLEEYTVYPKIWAPYYTLDKIMNGLYDCYCWNGNENALEILLGIATWVNARLSKLSQEKLNKMWSMYIAGEFGFMISSMINVYRIEKNDKFLDTSRYFINQKLFYPIAENIDVLNNFHANQHIPQIIGALDLYEMGGNIQFFNIAKNFWTMVTKSHVYSNGGIGETEMFKKPNEITTLLTQKTAESCASFNMLKLTSKLFSYEKTANYFEYYELVLYNHILASRSHSSNGGTTYFLPMECGSQKSFDTTKNTCCHGTGLESRLRYTEDIVHIYDKDIYVNLFISSNNDIVTINFDELEDVKIKINCMDLKNVYIRIPSWTESFEILNNNTPIEFETINGYAKFENCYKDEINIIIKENCTLLYSAENENIYSIKYGPWILACINEENKFINIDKDLLNNVEFDGLNYKIGEYIFKKIADIDSEKYHLYFSELM